MRSVGPWIAFAFAVLALGVPMFRLYNPYSGAHNYTTSEDERAGLRAIGWRGEGVAWYGV